MRYHRLKLVNKRVEKLNGKTVAIVGCGSLGSKNALLLARWGVNLILIDFDDVHEANLGTQEYCEKDVGQCKAKCLMKKVEETNSSVKVTAINKKLTAENAAKLLRNADIVIDATDNLKTRFVMNDACKALRVPWIYGAVERNSGVVAVFGSKYGFDKMISKNAEVNKGCDTVGVTPEIASIIAGIQSSIAVKLLTGQRVAHDVAFVDLGSLTIERAKNKNY